MSNAIIGGLFTLIGVAITAAGGITVALITRSDRERLSNLEARMEKAEDDRRKCVRALKSLGVDTSYFDDD